MHNKKNVSDTFFAVLQGHEHSQTVLALIYAFASIAGSHQAGPCSASRAGAADPERDD